MSVRVLVPLIAVVMVAGPAWADDGDASRGTAYAGAMCASCHSISAAKDASPNPGAPPLRDMKLASGEALAKFFNTTHPNTGRILKDTQADDIFAFIQDLKAQSAARQ